MIEVKSVLTVLGYQSALSVANIKTAKILSSLEATYTMMRSNKPTEMFERFPALEHVDFFTPGMKSIILDVAARFRPKPNFQELEQLIKTKVLRQAKKVSSVSTIL